MSQQMSDVGSGWFVDCVAMKDFATRWCTNLVKDCMERCPVAKSTAINAKSLFCSFMSSIHNKITLQQRWIEQLEALLQRVGSPVFSTYTTWSLTTAHRVTTLELHTIFEWVHVRLCKWQYARIFICSVLRASAELWCKHAGSSVLSPQLSAAAGVVDKWRPLQPALHLPGAWLCWKAFQAGLSAAGS